MSPLIQFYFSIRHLFPRPVRLLVRRQLAYRKRRRLAAVWPIDPASAEPPEQWPGWHEKRRFAFALTHDVEGPKGLRRVKALAELEMEAGFRSTFFFVPEGSYTVPLELVGWLRERGFEVGVHDLRHDGKLFDSEEGFRWDAKRINHYLKEWGAVGFRAAFMLRNLEWMHHLDIEYDASTFDTDPFEPQPDAAGTVFPLWIANEARRPVLSDTDARHGEVLRKGYVELPYSIPQDSTAFLLFQEKSIALWKRKLDWVAKVGGMALLNVHPDYIRMEGGKPSSTEFPVELYREFLSYLKIGYDGGYWNPLLRDLARWTRQIVEAPVSMEPGLEARRERTLDPMVNGGGARQR